MGIAEDCVGLSTLVFILRSDVNGLFHWRADVCLQVLSCWQLKFCTEASPSLLRKVWGQAQSVLRAKWEKEWCKIFNIQYLSFNKIPQFPVGIPFPQMYLMFPETHSLTSPENKPPASCQVREKSSSWAEEGGIWWLNCILKQNLIQPPVFNNFCIHFILPTSTGTWCWQFLSLLGDLWCRLSSCSAFSAADLGFCSCSGQLSVLASMLLLEPFLSFSVLWIFMLRKPFSSIFPGFQVRVEIKELNSWSSTLKSLIELFLFSKLLSYQNTT